LSRTLFFFFQAEDGIRDFHVTGVQTCALPISQASPQSGADNIIAHRQFDQKMTETVYLFLGILLILGIFLDILFTTYSMEGGGKMTDVVLSNVWKLILWIARYQGTKKMLNHAGMFMMFGLILLWGLGLWVGFFLILASDPNSILSSGTGTAASLGEKFYFSGYILSTMGLGDYEPNNAVWGTVS